MWFCLPSFICFFSLFSNLLCRMHTAAANLQPSLILIDSSQLWYFLQHTYTHRIYFAYLFSIYFDFKKHSIYLFLSLWKDKEHKWTQSDSKLSCVNFQSAMDAGPWANLYAVKLQQQQNQFNNNSNSANNRNNGSSTIQQGCYNLNNFNQNQMYTQNMESLLAHYSNNNDSAFPGTFNSHHNAYDAEFFSNQFQNAAKASLSAGLLKCSSKTKDSK